MTRTRCLFAVPSMRGGGAERVVCRLLNQLDPAELDLHLAVVRCEGPYLADLPPHVTVHDLQAERVLRGLIPLVRLTRRLQPHVVLSTVSHMNVAAGIARAAFPRRTRLVLRESSTCQPIMHGARWPGLRRALYRRGYRQADAVVCQTRYMADDLAAHFELPRRRLLVLPNPIDIEQIRRLADQPPLELPGAGPHVVALGRLAAVKGLERLLRAWPALVRRQPAARLWIVGQGPLRAELERLAGRLPVADQVRFVGFQRNPYRWLRAADLLVVSSQYESCPNVLLEAVAVGCPPVVLEHPGGTRELLDHLGLADRFVARLEPWSRAWFRSLPAGAVARLEQRHAAATVARQYAAVLQGSSPAAATEPLPPRLLSPLRRAGETT